MLQRTVKVVQLVVAGFLAVGTPAIPASAAPALQWSPVGPRGGTVANLTAAAGGAGVLWTALPGLGLARSIDGGASWQPAPLADPQSYSAVVTDPVDPLTVYAEGRNGLAKTTDGGATWRVISPTPNAVLGIAGNNPADPGAPRLLYMADRGDIEHLAALSRSDDGGRNWRDLGPLPPLSEGVYEVAVDPSDRFNVYVLGLVFHIDVSPLVLHSTDGGLTWSAPTGVPPGYLSSLRWDPRSPGSLLGLSQGSPVRSLDGGASWQVVRAGLPADAGASALVVDPLSGAFYLTVQTSAGLGQIWTSTDGGSSWTPRFERAGALYPLAVDGALAGRLYAGAEDVGLLVSADAGRHWQVAGAGFLSPAARDLEPDPHAAGALYALLAPQIRRPFRVAASLPDLARSADGGATWERWTPVDPSGAPVYLSQLVFDPFVAGSIYSDSGPALYHSADGGRTWAVRGAYPAAFAGASSVAADPRHPGLLYAAGPWTSGSTSVLRSTDGGESWSIVLTVASGGTFLNVIAVDPTSPQAVYAGGRFGFWRSLDGGESWETLGSGLPFTGQWVVRLETDAADNLYAQLFPAGPHTLYKSADRGASWVPIDAGLPAGTQVRDLLAAGTTLYIATSNGVYLSPDGGGQWTAANDGLAQPAANRLAAGTAAGALVAATEGGLAVSPPPPHTCPQSDTVLCLGAGRFALRVHWSLADGSGGAAQVSRLTDESGGFWFFSPESVELVVKTIDGRAVNDRFWVFGGALSDVAYTLTVTDVTTGSERTYVNPQGSLASFADTDAFVAPRAAVPASPGGLGASGDPGDRAASGTRATVTAGEPCAPTAETLCLVDSRFAVQVAWRLAGSASTATAVPLLQNTGVFWFFNAGNPELIVKILDGRAVNGHFWVFFAGLSSVASTVTVTDTRTGVTRRYEHPEGALASTADTAF